MRMSRLKVLIVTFTLVIPFIFQPTAQALVGSGIKVGEYGITFAALGVEGNNYPLGSPTVRNYQESDGTLASMPNEYVGSAYSISAWMVPVGDHLKVDCQSTVKLSLLRDGTPISPEFPISSEDGHDYRIDSYSLKFEKVGTYTAKFSGGLTCKWRTDGHTDFNSAEQIIYIAKVVNMVVPTKVSVSTVQCPKRFKISTEKNIKYSCTVTIQDKDHVSDNLTMYPAYCGAVSSNLDKRWSRTPTGWKVPVNFECPMLTPNQYNDKRRVETLNFYIKVTDSLIRKGEPFTEFGTSFSPSSSYSYNATFVK